MKPRQIDIANALGISQQAVSAVLSGGEQTVRVSEKTAERIRQTARALGYRPFRPAQQLAGRSGGTIGVLIGANTARVHYRQLAELQRQAFGVDQQLSVGLIRERSQVTPYLDDFRSRGIETLICMVHEFAGDNRSIPESVADFDRVIYYNTPSGVIDPAVVEIDLAHGTRLMLEHLRQRGRGKIGLAISSRHGRVHAMRADAFAQAHEQPFDLDADPRLWKLDDHPQLADAPLKQIIGHVLDDWLLPGGFDAVIASNDEWAVHLILQLKRRGLRVPDDVAVAGQDNLDFATASDPEITTVDFCHEQVARHLLEMACRDVDRTDLPRQVILEPRLIVRGST